MVHQDRIPNRTAIMVAKDVFSDLTLKNREPVTSPKLINGCELLHGSLTANDPRKSSKKEKKMAERSFLLGSLLSPLYAHLQERKMHKKRQPTAHEGLNIKKLRRGNGREGSVVDKIQ
ncbi:hypothetical protein TNCV_5112831 [Trichonephila clavipes]|nr:hypothetical protein TNCV_5112831 [Trichonephila clavipes]